MEPSTMPAAPEPTPPPPPAPESARASRIVESPPAPELPRRPRRARTPTPPPPPSSSTEPLQAKGKRSLPTEPTALAAARASVAPTTELLLGMLDVAASSLPPRKPLSDMEREVIRQPLTDTVYVYLGGDMDPLAALALALGAVAMTRYVEWKKELAASSSGDA